MNQVEFLVNVFRIRFRRSQEFLRFCAVGALGVLVNLGIFLVLTRRAGLGLELASPIAIEVSILGNFLLNDAWTFRRRAVAGGPARRLLRFHLVSALAGVTNYALLLLLTRAFGLWDVAANLLGIAAGTFVNYGMNSLWTWKQGRPGPALVSSSAGEKPGPAREASGAR